MKIVSSENFSPAIADGWQKLSKYATSILQTSAWVSAISAFYAKEQKLLWVYLEDDRGPVATFLLNMQHARLRRAIPVRVLTSLNPRGILHADALVRPDAEVGQVLDAFLDIRFSDGGRWNVLRLGYLRAHTSLMRLLGEIPGCQCDPMGNGVAVLATTGDAEAWHSGLSTSFLADLRKSRSRLTRAGAVSVRMFTGDAEQSLAGLASFVELESSGWKGSSGALANDVAELGLFRSTLEQLAPSECAGVLGLYVDSRMVAGYVWVRTDVTLTALKTAYAEDLARMSPGKVLTEELIRHCFSHPGIERLDFCALADWHLKFGVSVEQTYSLQAYNPRTLLGTIGIWRKRLLGRKV